MRRQYVHLSVDVDTAAHRVHHLEGIDFDGVLRHLLAVERGLLGLLASDIGHLLCNILEHNPNDLSSCEGYGSGDAETSRRVERNGDALTSHAHVHFIAQHILVVEACFDGRQHGGESLPTVKFGFLDVEFGVLHSSVVLDGILLGLPKA